MRKPLVVLWLFFLTALIGVIFWCSAWKYALPTPVPVNYHDVTRGTVVHLPAAVRPDEKPLFLHFFNPDCPCSRFNMPQFKAMVVQYGRQVNFAIVLMSPKKYTARQLQEKFDLPYPVPVYSDSAIAAACGVYSTPQAVIIDAGQRLYYRGNYNRNRYCTDEKTGFARLALDGLLQKAYSPTFSPLALRAYGCQLPACTQ